MPNGSVHIPELEMFINDGWISEVIDTIKSGKEATVYRCLANPKSGGEYVAAKVYRDRQHRSFKNDSVYQDGRVILDKRIARAVAKKTKAGLGAQGMLWVDNEYETLKTLHAKGADVPRPIAKASQVILMEYIGDSEAAAPPLKNAILAPDEAKHLYHVILDNIELWLAYNFIHADLSPFNILYWDGRVIVIDFPQAVDPRFNRSAFGLLLRDIGNVHCYFAKYGVGGDPFKIASDLWNRFQYGEL